ncbi:hypothetical protein [Paenibacillus medicaginis]|uniref:Single-stranded DNA-binding protein n=1 Tax=Paenibacillus medicaginis TaxID=1470560 RepID=A0ABV5BV40_9BACL
MADKSPVKTNKNHGGKEFKGYFHFVGKLNPVRKKDEVTDNWEDQPIYEETKSRSGKPMRKVHFNVETAEGNELKIELFGMEQAFVWPYSSTHNKAHKIVWSDRHNKEKFPDDTYHLIDPDWDKAEKVGQEVSSDKWVEVRGHYEPNEFTTDDGKEFKNVRRVFDSVTVIEDGQEIKLNKKEKLNYVCDFKSPDFKEVNRFNMQIGIRSTYADEAKGETRVNGVFLAYGKDRSEPKDVELVVYQTETTEGKKSLADAFASLEALDFIEVVGVDNNRATFAEVPVEDNVSDDDPFADVDESNKQIRYERVVNGSKKGLEITGYVTGTLIRKFLTEEEISKSIQTTNEDPFSGSSEDPFTFDEDDLPF